MYSMRSSNANTGTPQRQQPSYVADAYEGYPGAALQFGQPGPASILRSRQTSLEKGFLPADSTLGRLVCLAFLWWGFPLCGRGPRACTLDCMCTSHVTTELSPRLV